VRVIIFRHELPVLTSSAFIDDATKKLFISDDFCDLNRLEIEISIQAAEYISDGLTNQLAVVGFDDDYDLTDEGKILEDLIDRFSAAGL
jgi:hypothetical protein